VRQIEILIFKFLSRILSRFHEGKFPLQCVGTIFFLLYIFRGLGGKMPVIIRDSIYPLRKAGFCQRFKNEASRGFIKMNWYRELSQVMMTCTDSNIILKRSYFELKEIGSFQISV